MSVALLKKTPQKLLIRALGIVSAYIMHCSAGRYVRSNYRKGADQKFFAELFFKKATTPRPQAHYLISFC